MKRVGSCRVLAAGLLALGLILAAGCPDQAIVRVPTATLVVSNHFAVEQHIFIDETWRGAVAPGQTRRLVVTTGRHVVIAADSVDPNDNPETGVVIARAGEDQPFHVSGEGQEKTVGRYPGFSSQRRSTTALQVINHAEQDRHVFVDENWMGSIPRRSFRVYPVSPGRHAVMVSHSRDPDDRLMTRDVDAAAGQITELQIYQQGAEELFVAGRPSILGTTLGVPVRIINSTGVSQHIYAEGQKLGVVGIDETLTVFVHFTRPVVTVTHYARGKGHPVSREFDMTVDGPYIWDLTEGEE